jgi:hypothetical protein
MQKDHSVDQFIDMIKEKKDGTYPSLDDFKKNKFFFPEQDFKDPVQLAISLIENEHFCIISGSPRSGKTWLACRIGYEIYKKSDTENIWWYRVNQEFTTNDAWKIIDLIAKNPEKVCYLIFDDCHNTNEFQKFLETINIDEEKNLRFLFIIRKGDLGELAKFSELKCEIKFPKNKEGRKKYAKNIVNKFIETENVREYVNISEDEIDNFIEKWHNNLSNLHDYLWHGWKFKEKLKLSEINEDFIVNKILKNYPLDDKKVIQILLPIAALCQFEPLVLWRKFLYSPLNHDLEKIEDILQKRIVETIDYNNETYLKLPERDAELILRYAQNNLLDIKKYSRQQIQLYIKSYPTPGNWIDIFRGLNVPKDNPPKRELAKNILFDLTHDEENWQFIINLVKKIHTVQAHHIFTALKYMGFEEKANELWHEFSKFKEDQIVYEISTLGIQTIARVLNIIYEINKKYGKQIVCRLSGKSFFSKITEKIICVGPTSQTKFFSIIHKIGKVNCPNCGKKFWPKKIECKCKSCKQEFNISPFEKLVRDFLTSLLKDQKVIDDYQTKLKFTTARNIKHAIPILATNLDLRVFFGSFEKSDWINIINSSTLRSVRQLQNNLMNFWRLDEVCQDLNTALLEADLPSLFSRGTLTLYRLNGVIGNIMQISIPMGKRFIEKLTQIKFYDELIFYPEPLKEITPPHVVNGFLDHRLKNYPNYRIMILNNFKDETWFRLLDMASPKESFNLMWNIYIDSQEKAKNLFTARKDELLKKWAKENWGDNLSYYFSSKGLLFLLGYDEKELSFDLNISDIKELIKNLREENVIDFSNISTSDNSKNVVYNDLQKYGFLGEGLPFKRLKFIRKSNNKIEIIKNFELVAILEIKEEWCYLSNKMKNIVIGVVRVKNGDIEVQRTGILKLLLSLIFIKIKLPSKQFEEFKNLFSEQPYKESIYDFIKNHPDPKSKEIYQNLIEKYIMRET